MTHQKPVRKLLQTGDFVLNLEKTTLNKGENAFHLTPKETRLMALLMDNVGRVVSRDQLMKEVWHADEVGNSRTLDVHIHWLRQKIEDNPYLPEYILTCRGRGYQFRIKD